MSTEHHLDSATGPGHETRDVSFRPIVLGGLALVVLVLVTMVAMRVLLGAYVRREARESPPASPLAGSYGLTVPPAPRLQTDPHGDLVRMRTEEADILSSYGWVDRDAGVVRIPIDRAMALLVERRGGGAK